MTQTNSVVVVGPNGVLLFREGFSVSFIVRGRDLESRGIALGWPTFMPSGQCRVTLSSCRL